MSKKLQIIFKTLFIFLISTSISNAELLKPTSDIKPTEVVKIQLLGLQKNDLGYKDSGIEQTWNFAHPNNKKVTGPYERFRVMIYGQQYKFLINHSSHKIKLITNTSNTFIYRIEILSEKKQLFFYEWQVEKGSDDKCINCWFTSAVSKPVDQGNTI